MTIDRSLAVALALIASVVGAFIGRAIPDDDPNAQAAASASSRPAATVLAVDECATETAALASTNAQLAICMAFDTRDPETAPSGVPEKPEPEPSAALVAEARSFHDRLAGLSEAVIVQHADGAIGIYKPDEWPTDGDGLIIGRKLPDGQVGWYAGPDAGPRSDPAAFGRPKSTIVLHPAFVREADGTIRARRNAPPAVQRMSREKGEEQATP